MTPAKIASGPNWLHQRIERDEVVIIDGATGTELEARGVPMHEFAWSVQALFEYGHVVREVHEDYIRAGADVVITNTFSTGRHLLDPIGYGDRVEALNREAVELALQARDAVADRPVAIAGSMSSFMARPEDPEWFNPETLRSTFTEQANLLAEAGVDLIALEMLQRPESARPAVQAAVQTGLPVWVGVSCKRSRDSDGLATFDYPERDFKDVVSAVTDLGAGLINVMHSEVHDTAPGIELVRQHWSGPIGAYPNSGYFKMPNWQFVDIIPPDELIEVAKTWVTQGVQVIGGCCGIGPEHIRRLKQELPTYLPPT
ncbi:MAG: homocysteine S-methyltransferase family protein [Gammaproteobacteria bacterium]|nr:homocysteine S-methyltransferase family protein [Gammaproteobacteria bacterium]